MIKQTRMARTAFIIALFFCAWVGQADAIDLSCDDDANGLNAALSALTAAQPSLENITSCSDIAELCGTVPILATVCKSTCDSCNVTSAPTSSPTTPQPSNNATGSPTRMGIVCQPPTVMVYALDGPPFVVTDQALDPGQCGETCLAPDLLQTLNTMFPGAALEGGCADAPGNYNEIVEQRDFDSGVGIILDVFIFKDPSIKVTTSAPTSAPPPTPVQPSPTVAAPTNAKSSATRAMWSSAVGMLTVFAALLLASA